MTVSRDEQDDTRSKRVRMAADAMGCTLGRRGKPWDEEWQEVELQCKDRDGFRFHSLKNLPFEARIAHAAVPGVGLILGLSMRAIGHQLP